MEPKTLKYFVIIAAIILLIGSLMYFLMLSTVILLIIADWTDPLFHYHPGAVPYLLGVPAFFLLFCFIALLWLRASPATNRMIFVALGVVSTAIGVLYFLFAFSLTALGSILMYTCPIIGGVLTIIAPFLKTES